MDLNPKRTAMKTNTRQKIAVAEAKVQALRDYHEGVLKAQHDADSKHYAERMKEQ